MGALEIQQNLRVLLSHFSYRSNEHDATRFDSRFIIGLLHEFGKSHADWMGFIKEAKTQLAYYGEVDLRISPHQEEFAMLTADHVRILICFDTMTFPSASTFAAKFKMVLALVNYCGAVDYPVQFPFHVFFTWQIEKGKNKTLEEIIQERNQVRETPLKKEKRLEREFGEKLIAQGISVQYQVRCEYGIADIVTPEAIYEIKASLTRSNLHKAASQVLLYRSCINPSAKAIVVGYPHKKQPVNFEMAKALGVEVIVCEDTEA